MRRLPENSALLADLHEDNSRRMMIGRVKAIVKRSPGAYFPPTVGEQIDEGLRVLYRVGEEDE